jgi:hypothetical protein
MTDDLITRVATAIQAADQPGADYFVLARAAVEIAPDYARGYQQAASNILHMLRHLPASVRADKDVTMVLHFAESAARA